MKKVFLTLLFFTTFGILNAADITSAGLHTAAVHPLPLFTIPFYFKTMHR
jgi:hypothetical protein